MVWGFFSGLPPSVPHVPLWRVPFLPRRRRVWHARRNTEMLLGLALKTLARMDLKFVFTSASQRRHTGYTKWLISRMDALEASLGDATDDRKTFHGGFGWLNAREWFELVEMHTRHHRRQQQELEGWLTQKDL